MLITIHYLHWHKRVSWQMRKELSDGLCNSASLVQTLQLVTMHRPWKKPASSFPSDLIKPVVKGQSNKNKNSKGNANSGSSSRPDSDTAKSKEVQKLENFLQAFQTASGLERDPKGGCYCLGKNYIHLSKANFCIIRYTARIHDVSLYVPICRSCGLILCSLNQPHYCCPSCHQPLLSTTTMSTSSPTREAIITQLESQLATTISQEIEDRQRALEEARKAAGAFPALSPSTGTNAEHQSHPPANQTHKVMSLTGNKNKNNKNRRTVTISSYTTKQPSRSGSVTPNVNDEPTRVKPPNPPPITTKLPKPNRPFENFLHGNVTYKPCAA